MRSMRSLVTLLALTLAMLAGITAVVSPPQAASTADELVLIASASNRGEVDPCG
jgi:hypothetical protein